MSQVFDPFGDFAERGYLRNRSKIKDMSHVKRLEDQLFRGRLEKALTALHGASDLTYESALVTHRLLFSSLYPWAGEDRLALLPNRAVSKGSTQFAYPSEMRLAFEAGLRASSPGQTLGYWAYAHPFLECNGRALFTVFSDHLRRQGLFLDWSSLERTPFLEALDRQILDCAGPHLQQYLAPYIKDCSADVGIEQKISALTGVPWHNAQPAAPSPKP